MQRLRRLLRQRSVRRSDGAFVVEGTKVLEAALDAGAAIEAVYFAPEAHRQEAAARVLARLEAAGVRCFALRAGVIERVADTTSPQSLCGVVAALDRPAAALVASAEVLFVCVDVRDPGNLGAIMRSAAAAGVGGVICCEGSADPYNPKVVRASAGALFSVPIALGIGASEAFSTLRAAGFSVLGTLARGGEDYATATLSARLALVLGNEASGLPPELAGQLDGAVSIPMASATESLNVAMAATVLAFEIARRRRQEGATRPGAPSI
ncbi:MAG: RNA methyltransferase [Actinomycetota bacterium]|nr:RNA methyltransferase [Actinomycetota bacterium]